MSNEENNEIESEQENSVPEAEVETNEDPAALLEDARNKADEHWNELLRARADMENLRRRQARDLENAHKHALDKFVTELLPIYDSMELGLNAAKGEDASIEAVREGLEMTMKMFLSSIAKFGLEQVNPAEGDDFDPELHQAMGMAPAEGVEPNKILNVAQKGFLFNGRLLRPAMVMVSQ
ncbi:MAG: nucleotide exchange factor GrpE [Gammaproteobacteria bacterium]|nr:nucleotide exchange factor GrpE [Gammaproteobacteria bacterium]